MSNLEQLTVPELYHLRVSALAALEMYREQLMAVKTELSRRANLDAVQSLDNGEGGG